MRLLSTLLTTVLAAPAVLAHDGHGLSTASHWHATDVMGFIAVVAVLGAVLLNRRDR